MEWDVLFDYTPEGEGNALYQIYCEGITFYLANGNYDVPDGKWGIGTCNCCNNTLLKEFDCESVEMARVFGKQYVKEYLASLINSL